MSENSKKKNLFAVAGNSAKEMISKSKELAKQTLDVNEDGLLDREDAVNIASKIGGAVKKGANAVIQGAEETAHDLEMKILQPIYPATLAEEDFYMSKFIRITERQKIHRERSIFEGSIGYVSNSKGYRIINVFFDSIQHFALDLLPDDNWEFYYIDPIDKNKYIALDTYFSYLEQAQTIELETIAQELGAKHFKITRKEERISLTNRNNNKTAGIMTRLIGKNGASAEQSSSETHSSNIAIFAEKSFPGKDPAEPDIHYLRKDPGVQGLIKHRMHESSPTNHEVLNIKLSNTSGIKQQEAVKIDAFLKSLKFNGNTSVESEVQSMSRKSLEYEIDF